MARIYYPFAAVFGNTFILQEKYDDGFQVFVEKNDGFGGDFTAIVHKSRKQVLVDVLDIREMSENNFDTSLVFIQRDFDYMNHRAEQIDEGKRILRELPQR